MALDPETKLIPSYRVGKRNGENAVAFMNYLSERLRDRFQLSSDALAAYVAAVERAFGADVDYGQEVKFYAPEPAGSGRYSPPRITEWEGPVAKFFRARFVRELRSAEPASTRSEVGIRPPEIPVRNQKLCHPALSRGSHTGREKFATGPLKYPLRNIEPYRASLAHGRLPWWLLNTTTLAHRCCRGASTPSRSMICNPGVACGRRCVLTLPPLAPMYNSPAV